MRNFRNYDIWKDSMLLAKNVCQCTKTFTRYIATINQIQTFFVIFFLHFFLTSLLYF